MFNIKDSEEIMFNIIPQNRCLIFNFLQNSCLILNIYSAFHRIPSNKCLILNIIQYQSSILWNSAKQRFSIKLLMFHIILQVNIKHFCSRKMQNTLLTFSPFNPFKPGVIFARKFENQPQEYLSYDPLQVRHLGLSIEIVISLHYLQILDQAAKACQGQTLKLIWYLC